MNGSAADTMSSGQTAVPTWASATIDGARIPVLLAEESRRDPFAPPAKDAPDRPWQPRLPAATGASTSTSTSTSTDEGDGRDGGDDAPPKASPPRQGGDRPQVPPPHPWSPGWQGGQLGRRPDEDGGGGRGQGPWGQLPPPGGPQSRFDPTDPAQRRARYALLSGMWGIFFFILGVPYLTLLLAALALYWSISALRAKPKPNPDAPSTPQPPKASAAPRGGGWAGTYQPATSVKPQAPAAMGGLLAALLGLAMVGAYFTVHLVYKPYFDCVQDALTQKSQTTCAQLLPEPLRGYFSQTTSTG